MPRDVVRDGFLEVFFVPLRDILLPSFVLSRGVKGRLLEMFSLPPRDFLTLLGPRGVRGRLGMVSVPPRDVLLPLLALFLGVRGLGMVSIPPRDILPRGVRGGLGPLMGPLAISILGSLAYEYTGPILSWIFGPKREATQ